MTLTGSLQIKGNKYYSVIYLPETKNYEWKSTGISVLDPDGKGKARNHREAEKALRECIKAHEEHRTAKTRIYFVDWLENWLENTAPKQVDCKHS